MTEERIQGLVAELKSSFAGAQTAADGARTLVRLPAVPFPRGCEPQSTEALVAFTPGSAVPELFLKAIPKRPDGGTPKSTGTTTVGGESWCTFSFTLPWDENRHSAEQFVLGRIARFARNE